MHGTAGKPGERSVIDVAKVWGAPLVAVHCAHCGEAHLVPEGALPDTEEKAALTRCPFCLHGPLARQPAYLREEAPERVLPYGVVEDELAGVLERWSRGVWFAPRDLKPAAMLKRARRYLVPLWLVDGRVEGFWRADVGFDYQVVSYQDQYRELAGWSSRQVEETRVRWEPRVGRLDRTYENVAAPALDDHRQLMGRLGGFDLSQSTEYSPLAITGAAVRIPSLEPEAAWPAAEAALARVAEEECREAAGADHVRGFLLQAEHHDVNWTLMLLPAYVTWYEEGGRVWPVVVNGQNGRVSGVRRASARKANVVSLTLGAVALLLFLIGGGLALLAGALPPATVIGGVLLAIALLLAVLAPVPALGVWVFNRRSAPGLLR